MSKGVKGIKRIGYGKSKRVMTREGVFIRRIKPAHGGKGRTTQKTHKTH